MSQPGPNPYLRTKILTASPEELRLMLFDGALKQARLARQTLAPDGGDELTEKIDFEKLYEHVSRCQKIVLELSNSMKSEVAPEIVEKLSALYNYVYRLLIDVNMDRQLAPLDEAIKLLDYERQTWVDGHAEERSRARGQALGGPRFPAPGHVAAGRARRVQQERLKLPATPNTTSRSAEPRRR